MCIYCDRVVNTNLKDINKPYIEDTIYKTDWLGQNRKFMISKYEGEGYTLDYESDNESFSMGIKYCPMCGRKL